MQIGVTTYVIIEITWMRRHEDGKTKTTNRMSVLSGYRKTLNLINNGDLEGRRLLQLIGMSLKVPGVFFPRVEK